MASGLREQKGSRKTKGLQMCLLPPALCTALQYSSICTEESAALKCALGKLALVADSNPSPKSLKNKRWTEFNRARRSLKESKSNLKIEF